MLAPIDPKTQKVVPKKDRDKFARAEDGYYGRDLDKIRGKLTERSSKPRAEFKVPRNGKLVPASEATKIDAAKEETDGPEAERADKKRT